MLQRNLPTWQRLLAEAYRDPLELLDFLQLPRDLWNAGAGRAANEFKLRVPRGYAARMRKGDPDDPLLRQVLPLDAEMDDAPGFLDDPVGDIAAMPQPGLLHKYRGRVLLVATGACAVHCRYCFRRHFPYADAQARAESLDAALRYVRETPHVDEVILSGGDPLSLSDQHLAEVTQRIACIPHVRRLRIHTRLPIVVPERVTDEMLRWMTATRLLPVMVVHANHAAEITPCVRQALSRLRAAGVLLLNQAVLLKGVNDSASVLLTLSEALIEAGVHPYYLHMLDRVRGAAHFEVDEATARALVESLRQQAPGYMIPQLVREIPGAASKTPLR